MIRIYTGDCLDGFVCLFVLIGLGYSSVEHCFKETFF